MRFEFVRDMRGWFRDFSGANPSAAPLLGVLGGILSASRLECGPAMFVAPAAVALLFAAALLPWRGALTAALFSAVGFASFLFFSSPSEGDYRRLLPSYPCGAIVEAVVDDANTCGRDFPWLDNPNPFYVRVTRMRFSEYDEWRGASGVLAVNPPRGCGKIFYGDTLVMRGAFMPPGEALFPGDFNYALYLRAKGVGRIFMADDLVKTRSEGGWSLMGSILSFRDVVMAAMVKNVDDDAIKGEAASLIFGFRQGLRADSKAAFIRSGTIHVFSVSGFHVAVLAFLCFMLLRWVPFRARHAIVPAVVILYTLTTGAQAPAVRAALMISAWCAGRIFLRSTPVLNVVFFSALAILAASPFQLFDIGFQYSFTIVALLILASDHVKKWTGALMEVMRWTPREEAGRWRRRRLKAASWTLSTVAYCLVAWLGGVAVTAFYQGLFAPSSILANLVMAPFVSALFFISMLKIFATQIGFVSETLGLLVVLLMRFVNGVCEVFAFSGLIGRVPRPPLWTVPVFYAALTGMLVVSGARRFAAFAACLLAVVAFWHLRGFAMPDKVAVLHGGRASVPAVVMLSPSRDACAVINMPSWDAGRSVRSYLAVNGLGAVDDLVALRGTKEYCDGAPAFLRGGGVERLLLPSKPRKNSHGWSAAQTAAERGVPVEFVEENGGFSSLGNCKITKRGNLFEVEYSMAGRRLVVTYSPPSRGAAAELRVESGGVGRAERLENRSRTSITEFTLP